MSVSVQQSMMPLQVAVGALLTKSIGSLYRIRDMQEAPLPIQKNVKHREAVIMAAATCFSLVAQSVLALNKVKTIIEKSAIAKYAILFQSALMALALCLGEITGRYVTPPLDWHDVEVHEVQNRIMKRKETAMLSNFLQVPSLYTMPNYAAKSVVNNAAGKTASRVDSPNVYFGQNTSLKLGGTVGVNTQSDKVQRALNLLV